MAKKAYISDGTAVVYDGCYIDFIFEKSHDIITIKLEYWEEYKREIDKLIEG